LSANAKQVKIARGDKGNIDGYVTVYSVDAHSQLIAFKGRVRRRSRAQVCDVRRPDGVNNRERAASLLLLNRQTVDRIGILNPGWRVPEKLIKDTENSSIRACPDGDNANDEGSHA
jgi:hypothetical protein